MSGSTGATGTTASAGGDLQSQIQNALRNEPTLSSDNINVNVTDDTINLSGTVATGKEKQTAKRIAQSYAGNRKVKEHLTVSGKGNASNTNSGSGNMGNSDRDRDSGTSNPSGNTGSNPPSNTSGTNPEGNKTNPPSGSQPPVR